jgi:hypothetical protein
MFFAPILIRAASEQAKQPNGAKEDSPWLKNKYLYVKRKKSENPSALLVPAA